MSKGEGEAMKRLIAIVMTLLLALNVTPILCEDTEDMEDTAAVNEEIVNLIPLWDFEQGDVTQDGYYEYGCKIVEGGANETAHSMRIRGANSGNGQWLNDLKEDTDYEVTVYAKMTNRDETAYPTFGVNGYDTEGSYVAVDGAAEVYFGEEWTLFTLQFHTGVGCNAALVYTWTFGEGDVDFFIDEVCVRELVKTEVIE